MATVKKARTKAAKTTTKKTAKPVEKPVVKQADKQANQAKPRQLKHPKYTSFKLQKRIKHGVKVPSAFSLFKESTKMLFTHWRLFVLVSLVYGICMFVLLGGTGNSVDTKGIREIVNATTDNHSELISGITIFGALIGNATTAAQGAASAYVTVLLLMVSLATIWSLRELQAGSVITLRDAFYKGMRPFVPFLLVLGVMFFQLMPLMFGSFIYNIAITGGVFESFTEQAIISLPFILLSLLSLYMISSSIFALYIVTLPDMTPMAALRAARKIVMHRRFEVMRKVFVLPLFYLVIAAVVMLPLIYFVPMLVSVVFFALTILGVIAFHSYMYALYRSLL